MLHRVKTIDSCISASEIKMNANMASLLSVLCVVLAVMNSAAKIAAREFKVGGDSGWHEPAPNDTAFYNQWASTNRFQVGDSLVFEYQNDSVVNVERWEYFHCDSNNPIGAFDDGNSTVILGSPGMFYFISGTEDQCQKGEKLMVEVMSPRSLPSQAFSPLPLSHSHASRVSDSMLLSFSFFFCFLLLLSSSANCG